MAKGVYQAPDVTPVKNTVEEQIKTEVKEAVQEPVVPVTPAMLMKKEIDIFTDLLNGDLEADVEKRKVMQVSFIKTIDNILKMSPDACVEVLTYFVYQINSNPTAYVDSKVLGPLYAVRNSVQPDLMERYKKFITFILSYASNIQNRQRFLQLYDVRRFVNDYPQQQAENLNMFIYR